METFSTALLATGFLSRLKDILPTTTKDANDSLFNASILFSPLSQWLAYF